jgi:hypothetical protein
MIEKCYEIILFLYCIFFSQRMRLVYYVVIVTLTLVCASNDNNLNTESKKN